MYWDYAKEREGAEVVIGRNSDGTEFGFALVRFESEDTLMLQDIYIKPEHRSYKTTKSFFNEIVQLAKEFGAKQVVTTIDCTTNGATEAMKCNLHCGFELIRSDDYLIYLMKRID